MGGEGREGGSGGGREGVGEGERETETDKQLLPSSATPSKLQNMESLLPLASLQYPEPRRLTRSRSNRINSSPDTKVRKRVR